MENSEKYCQSCGMPMGGGGMYGTNEDGSKSEDYCSYCYQSGKFTSQMSMDEMIEFCVPFVVETGMSESDARQMLRETYPQLKRWKQ